MQLFLYKLEQRVRVGFDTYDSCVVVAASAEDARQIHPGSGYSECEDDDWGSFCDDWADSPDQVEVILLGVANFDLLAGQIVCSSFNAG